MYYPIIATICDGNVIVEMNLVDKSVLPDVRLFKVIDWDVVIPEFTISLEFVFKQLEEFPEVGYVEEITQEEYNNLRNEL